MLRLTVVALLCALLSSRLALAADDSTGVYDSTQDALDSMQQEEHPETEAQSAEDVISQFFPDVEEDAGTYLPSEFVDRGFLLRRKGPAKGSYSGRLYTKYSDDKVSGEQKWEKEFELNLAYKDVDSYFRFSDVNVFAKENDPLRWQKGYVRYKYRTGKVTVGSFGAVFGRGLALNMFEDRTLQFDNEAEGIKVEQDLKGHAELTALYGLRKLRGELSSEAVAGVQIVTPVTDDLDLGAHYVEVTVVDPHSDPTNIVKPVNKIIGGDITWRPGHFRFYGEIAKLTRTANEDASTADKSGTDGLGYYLNGAYTIAGLSLEAEYKDYRSLSQPFSVLPPVRQWQENRTASPNSDLGYGFGLNYKLDNGSLYSSHYAQDNGQRGGLPYTEFLNSLSSPTNHDFTWVLERWDVNNNLEKHKFNRATLNQIINDNWSSSLLIEHERRNYDHMPHYSDWTFEPEIAYRSKFNLIYTYELSGQDVSPTQRKEWKLFEIKYHPDQDQELYFEYGARQAGFVCSGGICRQEPEFSGFRVDYLLRF